MIIFIELVDKGAGTRAFQKMLGMDNKEIALQMKKLDLYRQVVDFTNQIKELQKNRKENYQQINELRKALLGAIEDWNSEQEDN